MGKALLKTEMIFCSFISAAKKYESSNVSQTITQLHLSIIKGLEMLKLMYSYLNYKNFKETRKQIFENKNKKTSIVNLS